MRLLKHARQWHRRCWTCLPPANLPKSYCKPRIISALQSHAFHEKAYKSSFFDFELPKEIEPEQGQAEISSDVLQRAYDHGIDPEKGLPFEADVGHRRDIGSRLIDQVASRQDIDLWSLLIDYRYTKDGISGVQDVLHGMRFRGAPVKLFADDLASGHVWHALLPLGLEDEEIMDGLCNPATGLGRNRETLFVDIVGGLLHHGQFERASEAARMLRLSHFRGREDALELFDIALANETNLSIKGFCEICSVLPDVRIYHDVMSKLWQANCYSAARELHPYLLHRHDYPTCFEDIEPYVTYLAKRNMSTATLNRSLEDLGISYSAQIERLYQQQTVLASFGDSPAALAAHSTRPRRLSDEFLARAFATKSISFDFTLSSLKIFGLVEVGPLSIREIALRAGDLPTFKDRLASLQEAKIDFGSSTFVIVMRNLCAADAVKLFNDILHSDQHHEVMEDREAQRRLLGAYYRREDWIGVNRTLAILNFGKTGLAARRRAARMLSRTALMTADWNGVLQHLTTIRGPDHQPAKPVRTVPYSLNQPIDLILSKGRYKNTGRQTGHINQGRYLVGTLQDMEMSGIEVGVVHWAKALNYLGDTKDIQYLEQVCPWLIKFYSTMADQVSSAHSTRRKNPIMLQELFTTRFQAAIIEWMLCRGSRETLKENGLQEQARRCKALIQTLCTGANMPLDRDAIEQAFLHRLNRFAYSTADIKTCSSVFEVMWSNNEFEMSRLGQFMRKMYGREFDRRRKQRSGPESFESKRTIFSNKVFEDADIEASQQAEDSISREAEAEDTIVEYRDLFRPASKDYRRNDR